MTRHRLESAAGPGGAAALGLALLLCFSGGCDEAERTFQIQFGAEVGSLAASCGQSYIGVGAGADTIALRDLRFYVSNIRFLDLAGGEVRFNIFDDRQFQNEQVALVDLEDGSGGCAQTGDPVIRNAVLGTAKDVAFNGVVFEIAVPFELNHQDVTVAEPPLNRTEMFWAWGIGRRFFRLDLDVNGGANRWNVHVGSTMCNAPSMLEPPTEECARPNRVQVRLENFDPEENRVVLDIQALLGSSALTADTTNTAFGCQSFPDDVNECIPLFPNFGMDFNTGDCVADCSGQVAFRVE